MGAIAPTVKPQGPSSPAPKTAPDAPRVVRYVLSRLPLAMVPVAKIAKHLGVPLPDAIEVARGTEADGLLATWGNYCLLSELEAARRGLTLASTPFRGEADPAAWYWVRSAGIEYGGNPGLIPLRLLPGSRRNRIWWLMEQRRLQRAGWPCYDYDELDPHGHGLQDSRPSHEPLEANRLAERLSEVARWARDQAEGRLPPRREDRRRLLAKSDEAEYRQAIRLRIGAGTTAPGWNPAHELIHIEIDSAKNVIHIALHGNCLVCHGRDLGPQEVCLGCCRSRADRRLDTTLSPVVA